MTSPINALTKALTFFLLFLAVLRADGIAHLNKTATKNYLKSTEITELASGVESVDCLYVINLQRRPEKWARVDALMRNQGLYPNRFEAVDGFSLSEKDRDALAGFYPIRMLPGETGCLLSHLSVIKDALQRNFTVVWICEDDIEFVESPHNIVSLIQEASEIDPNWDILYTDLDSKDQYGNPIFALGSDFRPDRRVVHPEDYYWTKTSVSENLIQIRQRYGLYSYLVSRKGLMKIYDYFMHVHLWTAIDIDIHYIPSIREYTPKRDIVSIWCDSPFSDTKAKLNGSSFETLAE